MNAQIFRFLNIVNTNTKTNSSTNLKRFSSTKVPKTLNKSNPIKKTQNTKIKSISRYYSFNYLGILNRHMYKNIQKPLLNDKKHYSTKVQERNDEPYIIASLLILFLLVGISLEYIGVTKTPNEDLSTFHIGQENEIYHYRRRL